MPALWLLLQYLSLSLHTLLCSLEGRLPSGAFLLTWVTLRTPVVAVHARVCVRLFVCVRVCVEAAAEAHHSPSLCCHARAGNIRLAQETHSLNSNALPASQIYKASPLPKHHPPTFLLPAISLCYLFFSSHSIVLSSFLSTISSLCLSFFAIDSFCVIFPPMSGFFHVILRLGLEGTGNYSVSVSDKIWRLFPLQLS